MELIISIIAVIISFVTFLYTVLVEYRGEQREKKQSTLEALNLLQEQVFDKLKRIYLCRNKRYFGQME